MPSAPYQYRKMFRDLLDLLGLDLHAQEPVFERGFWVGKGKDKVFVSPEALARALTETKRRAEK